MRGVNRRMSIVISFQGSNPVEQRGQSILCEELVKGMCGIPPRSTLVELIKKKNKTINSMRGVLFSGVLL
jgi:hypothetical protein